MFVYILSLFFPRSLCHLCHMSIFTRIYWIEEQVLLDLVSFVSFSLPGAASPPAVPRTLSTCRRTASSDLVFAGHAAHLQEKIYTQHVSRVLLISSHASIDFPCFAFQPHVLFFIQPVGCLPRVRHAKLECAVSARVSSEAAAHAADWGEAAGS